MQRLQIKRTAIESEEEIENALVNIKKEIVFYTKVRRDGEVELRLMSEETAMVHAVTTLKAEEWALL